MVLAARTRRKPGSARPRLEASVTARTLGLGLHSSAVFDQLPPTDATP
jgi:hypothetical protein